MRATLHRFLKAGALDTGNNERKGKVLSLAKHPVFIEKALSLSVTPGEGVSINIGFFCNMLGFCRLLLYTVVMWFTKIYYSFTNFRCKFIFLGKGFAISYNIVNKDLHEAFKSCCVPGKVHLYFKDLILIFGFLQGPQS